jgi:hypothetical protein
MPATRRHDSEGSCALTMTRIQILSKKADAQRRCCRDWLLPFMQNNQPKFLTKDELRRAAMREFNVSKLSFDMGWIMAIEELDASSGTSCCDDGYEQKLAHCPAGRCEKTLVRSALDPNDNRPPVCITVPVLAAGKRRTAWSTSNFSLSLF